MLRNASQRFYAALGVGFLATCVNIASANLTGVHAPAAGEASHADIFANTYGGVFTPGPNGAPSYTNGTITATRIEDVLPDGSIGDNMNLRSGVPEVTTTDQRWEDGLAVTSVEAKFAGFTQQFGYDEGSGYVNLFNVTGTGYAVSGSGSHHFTVGVPWNWARAGTSGTRFSENGLNSDGLDHLVTYRVTGLNTTDAVWMLFWEDKVGPFNGGSDRDFNDLAVEVRANVVPIPGAYLLGVLGFAAVGLVRRKLS